MDSLYDIHGSLSREHKSILENSKHYTRVYKSKDEFGNHHKKHKNTKKHKSIYSKQFWDNRFNSFINNHLDEVESTLIHASHLCLRASGSSGLFEARSDDV